MTEGPRIYNLFPLLAGPVAEWTKLLPRIAAMGFNWCMVNPFHQSGFSGSLYAVKDYYALDPRFRGDARKADDALLAGFVEAAGKRGIGVMMDLVVNHTSKDSVLVDAHPEWFARDDKGKVRSPSAIDPADASKVTVWGDLAEIDFSPRPDLDAFIAYFQEVIRHYLALGFRGFRCDAAYKVPPEVWRPLIAAARAVAPDALFAAETLGCRIEEVERLRGVGFDYLYNSAKWWDFRQSWLLDQYERYRHIAPTIAFPESHDTARLAADLAEQGITDPAAVERHYRQAYAFAAAFSSGLLMPMGFEYGARRRLNVAETTPADAEEPLFDLTDFIAGINAMKAACPVLNEEGPQWRQPGDGDVVALVRCAEQGFDWTMTLVNRRDAEVGYRLGDGADLPGRARDLVDLTPHAAPGANGRSLPLAPLEVRVLHAPDTVAAEPVAAAPVEDLDAAMHSSGIVIESFWPEIDGGRHAIKREVGDDLEVWATVFKEGHDKIAAVLKTRPVDQDHWDEVPMTVENAGLDLWRGRARLTRNIRHLYTVEAWTDHYETWCHAVEKKLEAGQDVSLELIEGRDMMAAAMDHARPVDVPALKRLLRAADELTIPRDRALFLLSPDVRGVMARCPDRSDANRYRELEAVVDRPAARFAAWYEFFPRSQGTDPGKSATFDDCIARLPDIRDMGFDVVYLPPIHPIGRVNRKGRNNNPKAQPGEPGSPYAIGAEEGGHTAIHPDLGTHEDFRRFVAAASDLGMEIAIDFAIQCAPDHPWIKEHPEWFTFRPDGTIKHAENPPKKYEDIVNVDFFGDHRDDLWRELRDVILFWVEQGVKTFRVDNPHTKPVPFWRWMIREVQDRHPEVLFLSEAFTRPPMLKMLGKAGFSQSYTYFTWRNFKQELIDYLEELTQTDVKEYLRPNFFANTPDILPYYLQSGGRPAFMVRFALAATLSSVYGIYSGFELCDNAAIEGREEYIDSEKYEIKPRDWNAPGNIKDFITRINRIRRDNPAMQELDNLRFYRATDDNVLFYGKMTPDRGNMVFVAVNLDPFDVRESDIEFPLGDMGVPGDEGFEVTDLLTDARHLWHGAVQRVRLDPQVNPVAVLRATPLHRVDHQEPCF